MHRRQNVRAIALEALRAWDEGSEFAENIIRKLSRKHALSTEDHAFLNAAVLGVLRNLTLLDHWIDRLRGGGPLKASPRRLLRLGLCQLLIMGVPSHAAVNETVNLGRNLRGLINAIMRRASREREDLLGLVADLPPPVRWSVPEFLIDRWTHAWGEDLAEAICEANNQPAPIAIRVPHPGEWPGGSPVADYDGFYTVDTLPREALETGRCYAQDPATSIAPRLLGPKPGERVLDACAAPGGKAIILAELMEGKGALIATDASEPRCRMLEKNLRRMHASHVEVAQHDWTSAPDKSVSWASGGFDAVLLDVPCSNTGVIRRRVDVRWRLMPGFQSRMADNQVALLKQVLRVLKPNGRIVYSTCSIENEENSEVVARVSESLGLECIEQRQTIPGRDGVDGAYCALLRRT